MQNSFLPRLYSTVFVFHWFFYSGIAFQNSHIIIFELLFFLLFPSYKPLNLLPLIVLSAVDDMEVDELDVTVLNEYRSLNFLNIQLSIIIYGILN